LGYKLPEINVSIVIVQDKGWWF